MRKDLQEAHKLAAAKHDLDHYKQVLQDYQEALIQQLEEKEEKAAAAAAEKEAKAAAAAIKRSNSTKSKAEKAPADDDGDVEMGDADDSQEAGDKKAKKRKAEDAVSGLRYLILSRDANLTDYSVQAPQRSDSVKKPKIKVVNNSSTPKAANGASTPKSAKDSSAPKAAKPKPSKKSSEEKKKEEPAAPKEPEPTAEELHSRKEVCASPCQTTRDRRSNLPCRKRFSS